MVAPPRRPSFLVVLMACALGLAGCSGSGLRDVAADAGDTPAPPAEGELTDVGYEDVAAWVRDEVADDPRPVIVKYFASWCGPCEAEVPVLLSAAVAHPEVAMLGIAHQDPRAQATAWIEEHGVDAIPTLLDLEGETARALGARGMPSVSFIDADGQLQYTHTGPIDPALLDEWIDHLAHDGPRPSARPDDPATDAP